MATFAGHDPSLVKDSMAAALQQAGLQRYSHQVGGHSTEDGIPAALTDAEGHFCKHLQAGERGDREIAFYEQMTAARSAATASASGSSDIQEELLRRLAQFVPQSFGVRHLQGHRYLVLEDVCAGYQHPCVLDIKIGLQTWYPWASQALITKYRDKDESTTQATLGFRLCGTQVHNVTTGQAWKADRHWGKKLNASSVQAALARFADNGALQPADVYTGNSGALKQLHTLRGIFQLQTSFHFYSASVLITYEGTAGTAEQANVKLRLVDFAHAFPASMAGGGLDRNFLAGLEGLQAVLVQLCKVDGSGAGQ